MLHDLEKNSYFYHIPKTGGRAYLHNTLEKPATGHAIIHHPPGMHVVVLVRCPVDRFLSCYYSLYGSNRPDHTQQVALLKQTPLKTLQFIINEKINLDSLKMPGHLSTQYRWHKNLRPEDVTYKSFLEYRNSSKTIKALMSTRVMITDEPELDEIIQKVKEVYSRDYEYFQNIPQAIKCLKEWV
jgi:hypothetical protein